MVSLQVLPQTDIAVLCGFSYCYDLPLLEQYTVCSFFAFNSVPETPFWVLHLNLNVKGRQNQQGIFLQTRTSNICEPLNFHKTQVH